MVKTIEIKCVHCGYFLLPDDHRGPCPKCGKEGLVRKVIGDDYVLSVPSIYTYKFIHEFYENDRPLLIFLIIFNVLSLLVGSIFGGFVGFIFGVMLFILSCIFTPYAVKKVREIRSG
jgi:hypothetical protein